MHSIFWKALLNRETIPFILVPQLSEFGKSFAATFRLFLRCSFEPSVYCLSKDTDLRTGGSDQEGSGEDLAKIYDHLDALAEIDHSWGPWKL